MIITATAYDQQSLPYSSVAYKLNVSKLKRFLYLQATTSPNWNRQAWLRLNRAVGQVFWPR